mmetsp:Transcript_20451/g.30783  ORF Transcript_20451/g.30783 Transcript_20451/m.30783 type:complete len:99 (+) Transcript_20451:623-919(+)
MAVVEEVGVEDAVVDVLEAEEEAVVEEEGTAIAEILGEMTDMIAEVEEEAGDTLTDMTTAVEVEEEIVDLTKVEEAEEEILVAHQGPSKGVMNGKVIN